VVAKLASCVYGETSLPLQGFRVNSRLRPVIDVLQSMAGQIRLGILGAVRRVRGQFATAWIRVMPADELRRVVLAARSGQALDAAGWAMLAGVIDFHQKRAHDVMRPRTEVVALPIASTEDAVRGVVRAEQFSRYPVYRESLDDVVGVFLAKDLWLHDGASPFSLGTFMREALYVPGSRPADRVLDDLRRTRAHMAIVLDEYGGTAGVVTMEDLVEQVVGDIADEYDRAMRRSLEVNGVLELAGSLSVIDVRSAHRLEIPEGEWTTLGGYAFARLGRLPKIGDRVPFPNGELEIIAINGRRVAALRVHQ
jgi:putative hemolysin